MAIEVQRAQDNFDIMRQYFEDIESTHLTPPEPVFRSNNPSASPPASAAASASASASAGAGAGGAGAVGGLLAGGSTNKLLGTFLH